jgi:hypothetical protein
LLKSDGYDLFCFTIAPQEHCSTRRSWLTIILFLLIYCLFLDVFGNVVEALAPLLRRPFMGGLPPTEPELQVLVFFVYICTQESMREVALQVGLSQTNVHAIVHRVTDAMVSMLQKKVSGL